MRSLKYLCLVVLFALGACTDDSEGDKNKDEDEIEVSDVCVELLECATIIDHDMLEPWEEMYDESSVCWDDDESSMQCEQWCADNMQTLLEYWWEYPWDCDADAPSNTKQIDNLDGITWEWHVTGPDVCLEDTISEVTLFTTFFGKNSWKFDGEKWNVHPEEGTGATWPLECGLSTETYYDFSCDVILDYGSELDLEGTFSSDWTSATGNWVTTLISTYEAILCEVEGAPILE